MIEAYFTGGENAQAWSVVIDVGATAAVASMEGEGTLARPIQESHHKIIVFIFVEGKVIVVFPRFG